MKHLKIHQPKIPSAEMGPPKILPPGPSALPAGRKEGGAGPRLTLSPGPVPYLCLGIRHPVAWSPSLCSCKCTLRQNLQREDGRHGFV